MGELRKGKATLPWNTEHMLVVRRGISAVTVRSGQENSTWWSVINGHRMIDSAMSAAPWPDKGAVKRLLIGACSLISRLSISPTLVLFLRAWAARIPCAMPRPSAASCFNLPLIFLIPLTGWRGNMWNPTHKGTSCNAAKKVRLERVFWNGFLRRSGQETAHRGS